MSEQQSIYERAGGLAAFEALIDDFYARVEHDELLRPIYPEDLEPGKRHLALFFAQYWGGDDLYSREQGHPRLRMRHAPFPITHAAAVRWARHMSSAIRDQGFPREVEAELLAYVARFTPQMINTPDEPDGTVIVDGPGED